MRPGGSRTRRIDPSGSTLAPATTSSRGSTALEPLDDDVALPDERVDPERVAVQPCR